MGSEILLGLLKIILINIVLSGDNAVVIALACRNLQADQQKKAIFWGSFGAVGLRVILTFIAVWLLQIPFVQVAGGILLLYISIKLLKDNDNADHVHSSIHIGEAIKTIIFADLIMSLDNVLAVAGAAGGNFLLIGLGLIISIPLIIWGSQLLMRLMNRFPIIVIIGAGVLGYTAGEMILKDQAIGELFEKMSSYIHYFFPLVLALMVVIVGKFINREKKHELASETVETSI
ncbi:TerC family protein [Paenibacillus cremeus]|uniref:TerC family protein n=1 Tax=Paenibacillus cremeus TaxID=2163881 RepID=A0A559K748_9BACL|nr:TerC family protein [Paenibacillus cremeus]TVY07946.1 TerC family protein [Paenibacillus cremeus]